MIIKNSFDYEVLLSNCNEIGYTILSKNKPNSLKDRIVCRDEDGYLYYILCSTVLRGSASKAFDVSNPYTIRNINKYIENNNLNVKLITGNYINSSTKMEWLCECGNLFERDWVHFKGGAYYCNYCKRVVMNKKRLSKEYVFNYIEQKGYKVLSECYIGNDKPLVIEDDNGYRYESTFTRIREGKIPLFVSPSNKFSIYNINKYIENNKIENVLISDIYTNNVDKLKLLCRCGELCEISWANLKKYNRCLCDKCRKLEYSKTKRNKKNDIIFSDGRYCPCDFCKADNIKECTDCKVYDYFKKNRRRLLDGWDGEEYNTLIDYIRNEKSDCINDVVKLLKNKTIEDVINILEKELITYTSSNVSKIKVKCHCCGKVMYRRRCEYNKDRIYCSIECRDKIRSVLFVGENNSTFNSKLCHCTNCNKEIWLPPNKYNSTNSFGDNHNFCSKECYWEYRSSYYTGDRWLAHHEMTEEEKDVSRKRMLKMLADGTIPQTMTKPHTKISNMLNNMGLNHINEFSIEYQSIDIYCEEKNMMIEIMGDYWHAHPKKYTDYNKLYDIQKNSVIRDRRKYNYVKKQYKKEILYLWEDDINNRAELCEMLINSYIYHNGVLDDYNSYNYVIEDNKLTLRDEIIFPYFMDNFI